MPRNKVPKSLKKFIRKQKSKIRRESFGVRDAEKKIQAFLERIGIKIH